MRIGDFIDHAGDFAQVALFRAPDLGTTGAVPVAQVLEALRAHNVIGVATGDIREVLVTREARTLSQKEIEAEIARALERRNGLGDAANLTLNFDRDVRTIQLDAAHRGALAPVAVRYETRNARFDVTFEIAREQGASPTRLRFTGTAIETVQAAIVTRSVERGEILKSSDVVIERRPKSEAGYDPAPRERVLGMQMRKSVRAGQYLRMADLGKPDLVQRDQNVTLIYELAGPVPDHARQGDGSRLRGRHRQCDQPAIQADGARHRHRPRPGDDVGRRTARHRISCRRTNLRRKLQPQSK